MTDSLHPVTLKTFIFTDTHKMLGEERCPRRCATPTPLHFYPFLQDGTAPLNAWNCSSSVYFPLLPFQLTRNFVHAHPIQLFLAPFSECWPHARSAGLCITQNLSRTNAKFYRAFPLLLLLSSN